MEESKWSGIFAPNPVLNTDYPLLVLDVRNGVSYPPRVGHNEMHWHDDLQFIYFVQGSARIDTPSQHFSCNQGEGLLILPNSLHRITSGTGSAYTSFVFPQSMIALMPGSDFSVKTVGLRLGGGGQPVIHFDGSVPWHAEMLACLELVRQAAFSAESLPAMRYRAAAYLCAAWSCYACNARPLQTPASVQRATRRLRAALSFMQRHFAEPIEIDDVARAALSSESSLLRSFREVLQTTPHAYLQSLRLNEASALLADKDISIARIASKCGFSDSSHLSHAFKKATGLTPSAYRKALRDSGARTPGSEVGSESEG